MVLESGLQSQTQSQNKPPSLEEEAVKRNTDCVYFLASPLTCKKGGECEYRHSNVARLNPRDCWYWLHSNCLNPKCAFRHPPLDGLLGNQVPAPVGSSASTPATVGASYTPISATKQGVPCVFFVKGHCMKGDWCPFLHVPASSSSKGLPVPGPAASGPTSADAASRDLKKYELDKKLLHSAGAKPVQNGPQENTTINAESVSFSNEICMKRRALVATGVDDFHGYRSSKPASNGSPVGLSGPVQESDHLDEPENMNGIDLEVSREPSPGFDVLVDDEGRDSDYYNVEDRYGMPSEHEARNEYDVGRSTDYNIIAGIGNEGFQDSLGYDALEQRKGQYGWEQHHALIGRTSDGSYFENRPYSRLETFARIDESDLRHRLTKNKKPNGLRSVISHEHGREIEIGGHWDELHSYSSRLRGRIVLPRRSPSPRSTDYGGMQVSQLEEPFYNGERSYRGGLYSRRDEYSVDFSGPKSLYELRNKRNAEAGRGYTETSVGKRKHEDGVSSDVWFEGPKSLEEILKRKRSGRNEDERKKDGGGDEHEYEGEYGDGAGDYGSDGGGDGDGDGAGDYNGDGDGAGDYGGDKGGEDGAGEYNGDGDGGEEEYDEEEFAKKMGVVHS